MIRLEKEPEGRAEADEEAQLLKACAESQNPDLRAIVTIALEAYGSPNCGGWRGTGLTSREVSSG